MTSGAYFETFLARYVSTVALVWAKQVSGTSFDFGNGIDVDASGNIYITGYFDDSATFGSGGPTATTLTSSGDDDIFLARYDSTRALLCAKQAGCTDTSGVPNQNRDVSTATGYRRLLWGALGAASAIPFTGRRATVTSSLPATTVRVRSRERGVPA